MEEVHNNKGQLVLAASLQLLPWAAFSRGDARPLLCGMRPKAERTCSVTVPSPLSTCACHRVAIMWRPSVRHVKPLLTPPRPGGHVAAVRERRNGGGLGQ